MDFKKINLSWHEKHREKLTFGQKVADIVARGMGSWAFIIVQTFFVFVWAGFNLVAWISHWDPYPFILLNLLFSVQAAYSAPVIMMSQNRQNDRDRVQALEDFKTNLSSKKEIEQLQLALKKIESEKLDKIIQELKSLRK